MTELDEKALEAAADALAEMWSEAPFSDERVCAITAIAAYLSHSPVPAGYRLVPVEPTQEMLEAGKYAIKGCPSTFERDEADVAYRAMLSAAPTVNARAPAVPDDVREAVETGKEKIVGVAILMPFRTKDLHDPRPTFAAAPKPARHHHVLHQLTLLKLREPPETRLDQGQGFVTSTGRYVDREEAWWIAQRADQLLPCAPTDGNGGTLYSEDVW